MKNYRIAILLFFAACNSPTITTKDVITGEPKIIQVKTHGDRALQLQLEGKSESAIREYYLHINQRLHEQQTQQIMSSENPYFYLILIGDIYLEINEPLKAKEIYLEAQKNNVAKEFIADRLRILARYYRKRKEYHNAMEILEQYRELDDLLFDSDRDEIAKELVANEQLNSTP
jgi:tetratricopeptide (TPR) repeat protein